MTRFVAFFLAFTLLTGALQAGSGVKGHPRRATSRAVVAFMRKDLGLPATTRFKRVRWEPEFQRWEVILDPPHIFDVWTVDPMATDYKGMCFF